MIISQEAIDREAIKRKGFYEFCKRAWKIIEPSVPFTDGKVIECLAAHCQAVTEERIVDLLINVPPGTGKSNIVSILWNAYNWGPAGRPDMRMIFGSFDPSLARNHAEATFNLVRSAWFVERWGNVLAKRSSYDMNEFDAERGGFRFSTSVGGKGTGRHGHGRVFDDPVKPPKTEGDKAVVAEIENANHWWRKVMASRRVNPNKFFSVGVMQRIHENDLSAQCMADGYQHVCLPMRFDESRAFETFTRDGKPFWKDWRTKPGELLFPVRFPESAVADLEKSMGGKDGPTASAQLQQAPAPPGGLVFKKDKFQQFTPGVDGPHARDTFLIITVDCSFKDSESADHVAIEVWGARQGKIYLYECIAEHLDLSGTATAVAHVLARFPSAAAVIIEDKANGPEVIKALQRGGLHNVVAFDPKTSKVARAHAANVSYQANSVYHLAGAEWLPGFETELATFPRARRDDRVDAATMGILYLAESSMCDFVAAVQSWNKDKPATLGKESVLERHFRLK